MENKDNILLNYSYGLSLEDFLNVVYPLNQTQGFYKHLIKRFIVNNYLCQEISNDKTLQDMYVRAENILSNFLIKPRLLYYKDNRLICTHCGQRVGNESSIPVYDTSKLADWKIEEQLNLYE